MIATGAVSPARIDPMDWLGVLLLLCVQLSGWLLLTGVAAPCGAIARWPALDYKSDRAFYPLMVSFSRYPFHDVYETVPSGSPRPPPAPATRQPSAPAGRGAARAPLLAKGGRKSFGLGAIQGRDWRHQSHPIQMPTKGVCQGLIYLPQKLEASGRRMLPPKMRKLLKYCGFL